jgi:hypothetical protein
VKNIGQARSVTHAYNPRYLGSGDWEDQGLRPVWAKVHTILSQPVAGHRGTQLLCQLRREAQIGGLQYRPVKYKVRSYLRNGINTKKVEWSGLCSREA